MRSLNFLRSRHHHPYTAVRILPNVLHVGRDKGYRKFDLVHVCLDPVAVAPSREVDFEQRPEPLYVEAHRYGACVACGHAKTLRAGEEGGD